MISRLRARLGEDDAGFSMILVIGFTFVLLLLVGAAFQITTQSLTSARSHVSYDAALNVAESGIDQGLAAVQANKSYTVGPSTGVSTFSSQTAEQSWAKATLTSLAASQPSLLQTTPQGQYLMIRPPDRQSVYAMSWVPAYGAANVKSRLLKAEYLFAPYKPTDAILTTASLNMSGSVAVTTSGSAAPVHSNGNITSKSSDTIQGPVTASGTYDCAARSTDTSCAAGNYQPKESVPVVNPAYTYQSLYTTGNYVTWSDSTHTASTYTGTWFDLCPDGSVRAPVDRTVDSPCDANAVVIQAAGTDFDGWHFDASSGIPTWTMYAPSSVGALWYVYHGNAVIDATHCQNCAWPATVIAEATPSTDGVTCDRTGGFISWNHVNVQNYVPGLIFEAGGDIIDTANNNASDGLIAAADQVFIQTSSANITGAIVAADQCVGSSSYPSDQVQGVQLLFDQTGQAPVASLIDTTLWLEYVG